MAHPPTVLPASLGHFRRPRAIGLLELMGWLIARALSRVHNAGVAHALAARLLRSTGAVTACWRQDLSSR